MQSRQLLTENGKMYVQNTLLLRNADLGWFIKGGIPKLNISWEQKVEMAASESTALV
jgi:hypothetical protein